MKILIKAALRLILAFMIYELAIDFLGMITLTINYIDSNFKTLWYEYAAVSMVYLVILIIFVLFWIYADRIVRYIAGSIRGNEITINTSNTDLLAVAMSIFGAYLIVNSLVDLGGIYAYQWQLEASTPAGVSPSQDAIETSRLVRDILSIIFGAGLVLGKNGIKGLWKWFNDIGKPTEGPRENSKAN